MFVTFILETVGNPGAGGVCSLPPASEERSGRPPDILKQTTVGHALTMHNNSMHLSWIFRNCPEPP